jgi:RND family efflux transporter MFP subunit
MNIANWKFFALTMLLLSACGQKTEEKKIGPAGTPVTVTQSEIRKVEVLEESVGSLESLADPMVAAEIAGRVAEIRVVAGNTVKTGQVLAVLNSQDASLSRQAAKSEAQRVETLSANQLKNIERLKQMREKNFISQAALDDGLAQAKASENQSSGARAQSGLAESNLSKTKIVAPIDGVVEKQIAVVGQYVKVGDPLFQVVAVKKLRARLPFPEILAGKLKRGVAVRLTNGADGSKVIAKVSEVRPMTVASNRSFDALVLFDNPGNWRPGATVSASVVVDEHANAIVVPEQSVVLRPAGKVVYVAEGDKVTQRMVQVGGKQDGWVEITAGVQANESVVVEGAGFLTDQAAISVARSSNSNP